MSEITKTKITLTPQISEWFRKEMNLQAGNGIRFFGRVYGETNAHTGFSAAMSRCDQPNSPVVDEVIDGIHYYIQDSDFWFFNGLDLEVSYDETIDGPAYHFKPNDGSKLDAKASASH